MAEIIKLAHRNASTPDGVLECAKGNFQDVLIIGYGIDGGLEVFSSAGMTAAQINFMMDQFKAKLLAGDYSED